jgi:hypothetical protein
MRAPISWLREKLTKTFCTVVLSQPGAVATGRHRSRLRPVVTAHRFYMVLGSDRVGLGTRRIKFVWRETMLMSGPAKIQWFT